MTPFAQIKRCGWIDNPSPANLWLTDREGQWIVSEQGGRRAVGADFIMPSDRTEFVSMNNGYGYFCGCLSVDARSNESVIATVLSFTQLSLKRCNTDPSLEKRDLGFNQDSFTK
ncbi:DUF4087 domain-containing protein [Marinobacter bohaiensis]|uniref:DUF4087 domain-containing protein n=1 Tax=Marinobacter bohaiensis TaxID=2201898 RepID=UPI000DAD3809